MTNYEFFKEDLISFIAKAKGIVRCGNRLLVCEQRDCSLCKEPCTQNIEEWLNAEHIAMVKENIYTVSTFESFEKRFQPRTPGYYFNLEDAISCVTKNKGDIWEGIYDYAVIEEVRSGLYPSVYRKWWYKWDNEECKYIEFDFTNASKDLSKDFEFFSCVIG